MSDERHYLELSEDEGSHKFYEAIVSGKKLTIRYGRIGDPGQTQTKSFATPEDAQELMTDHDSFIGPYDAYLVEEHVVRGDAPDAPLGAVGPDAKLVSLHHEGDAVPEPPAGATRVVDQRVLQALTPDAPPLVLIRTAWAPGAEQFGPIGPDAYVVREYRQMEPVGPAR